MAFIWLGWSIFSIGENVFARCWYSGCNFIVHVIKYVLYLRLCGGGCVCNILGMGPGFFLMSPLIVMSFGICGFVVFFCVFGFFFGLDVKFLLFLFVFLFFLVLLLLFLLDLAGRPSPRFMLLLFLLLLFLFLGFL